MIKISEIGDNISLKEWERNIGNREKAGKYFWLFSLMYCYHCIQHEKGINASILLRNYTKIFHKQGEIIINVLKEFDGIETSTVSGKELEKKERSIRKKIRGRVTVLNNVLCDYLLDNNLHFSSIPQEKIELYNLMHWDKKYSEFPSISACFKAVLSAGSYKVINGHVPINMSHKLEAAIVKRFNSLMNELLLVDSIFHIIGNLKDYKESSISFDIPKSVKGPTEALKHAKIHDPRILDMSNSESAYQIWLKYKKVNGDKLNKKSLKRIIRRDGKR